MSATKTKAHATWRVGYDDGSGAEYIVANDKAVATIRWGCGCCKPDGPLTDEEIERARLIAAAPDLLVALKAIVSDCAGDTDITRLAHARLAIAKATEA